MKHFRLPKKLFGGRVRTSTVALSLLFVAFAGPVPGRPASTRDWTEQPGRLERATGCTRLECDGHPSDIYSHPIRASRGGLLRAPMDPMLNRSFAVVTIAAVPSPRMEPTTASPG